MLLGSNNVRIKRSRKKGRRRKKRVPRCEELYTDKDRAAAVNMGSRDIKQSLSLKLKQDRSKALQIPEEADPGTFLALGVHEMKCGDVKIARQFLDKVNTLEFNISISNFKFIWLYFYELFIKWIHIHIFLN